MKFYGIYYYSFYQVNKIHAIDRESAFNVNFLTIIASHQLLISQSRVIDTFWESVYFVWLTYIYWKTSAIV